VNSVALPEAGAVERRGLRIPPDEKDCLTTPNFQVPR